MSRQRILDAEHRGGNLGFHLRFFKAEVGVHHFAVDEFQVFAVAERLGADDLAVFQRQTIGVPGQILSLYHAVAHRNIFAVPESILRVKTAIGKGGVFNILERIFSLEIHMVELDVAGPEQKILTFGGAILHPDAIGSPAEFRRINIAAGQRNIPALPHGFDAVEFRVGDLDVMGIPEGGPAKGRQFTVVNGQLLIVPERIPQIHKAVFHPDIMAFLQGAFTVGWTVKTAVAHQHTAAAIQCTFFIIGLVFQNGHFVVVSLF